MPGTKAQFLAKNKSRFDRDGLTGKQRSAAYNDSLASKGSRGTARMQTNANNRALKNQNRAAMGRAIGKNIARQTQPRRRGNNSQGGNMRGPSLGPARLSYCSELYAQALIDPWAVEDPPCIPDATIVPSFKFGARARGTFYIGTMGFGYIFVNPYAPWSTAPSGQYTNSAYVGTPPAQILSASEVNTSQVFTDSPFVFTQFSGYPNLYSRTVGSGLAVRYTGNEMARGGSIIINRVNDNGNPTYPFTATQMLQNKESVTVPVDRNWHYCVYKPAVEQDTAYAFINTNVFPMSILVQGAGPGQSFEYDWVTWFEVIGPQIPNLTPSHSDPLGLSVIKSATAINQPVMTPSQNWSHFLSEVGTIAEDTLSFLGRGVGVLATAAPFLTSVGLL